MKIAMPTLGQAAIHQAILHADPRRFLNQMAEEFMEEQMPQSTNFETLPPTAPPPQNGPPSATPAMDLDEEYQPPPSVIRREASPAPSTIPSTSAAAIDTQRSPRKVGNYK
jgi:hypothetical protein